MAEDRRRVLVLINTVEDVAGGNLRAAVNIAEALAGAGGAVTLSAPTVRGRQHRTVDLMDQRVDRRLFDASRPLARFGGSLRQLWWLWRRVRDFDEVQTHSIFTLSAVYAILICRIRRVPIVLWPHGSLDPFDLRKHGGFKRLVGPLVTRRLLDRCAALFFTTAHEARIAVTYSSPTERLVVPLPVEPLPVSDADPAAWRRRYGIDDDAPIVLFLGRIDYKKRLPLLVEAVSRLERRDVRLLVIGDGPASERALVAEAAERCGLTDRLHTTGWLEGADRVAAFTVADVFALLSDAENFGLSVIEAMSTGCPVVISDQVSLAPDLEEAGAVVVVERDAAAAARAIDRLLADPDEATAMGERARALVAARFAPAEVAARLIELSARWTSVRGGRNGAPQ